MNHLLGMFGHDGKLQRNSCGHFVHPRSYSDSSAAKFSAEPGAEMCKPWTIEIADVPLKKPSFIEDFPASHVADCQRIPEIILLACLSAYVSADKIGLFHNNLTGFSIVYFQHLPRHFQTRSFPSSSAADVLDT